MATYVITEACAGVKNAACVDVCPVSCIHTTPEASQYYIDPEVCIACEQCFFVCPVEAIYLDENLPPQLQHFAQINAEFFGEHKPAITPVSPVEAEAIAAAVHGYAAGAGLLVAVALVDPMGAPILVAPMPGAAPELTEQALNKAYTAARLRAPTHEAKRRDDRSVEVLPEGFDPARLLRVGGGYPLARGTEVQGAVGVAGGATPQQDVLCCQAALATLRF